MIDDYTFRPGFVEKIVSYARILRHFLYMKESGRWNFSAKLAKNRFFPKMSFALIIKGTSLKSTIFTASTDL